MRARQERVPFVTIEDRGIIEAQVTPLLGQTVALVASPEGAQLRPATAAEQAAAPTSGATSSSSNGNGNGVHNNNNSNGGVGPGATPLAVTKSTKPGVVALKGCTAAVGGAKAAACARLEQVRRCGRIWDPARCVLVESLPSV